MKQLSLLFLLLSLILFSGCLNNEDDEFSDPLSKGTFNEILPRFTSFNAQEILVSQNEQYLVAKIQTTLNQRQKFYYSTDKGNSWTEISNNNNSQFDNYNLSGISNNGEVLFTKEYSHLLYANGTTSAVKHPNGYYYDKAFLDPLGNIYYFINCNCSIKSSNVLSFKKQGSDTYTDLTIPEEMSFSMIGISPEGGIYYQGENQSGKVFYHNPVTEAWEEKNVNTAGQPNSTTAVGYDGSFYFGNRYGIVEVTSSGTINDMTFPAEMTYYQNPIQIIPTKTGRLFALSAAPNYLYEYTNGAWEVYDSLNSSTTIMSVATAGNSIYFNGKGPKGKYVNGIIKKDLTNSAALQLGHRVEDDKATIQDAIITKNNNMLVVLNNQLFHYDKADSTLEIADVESRIIGLYEDRDGKLFAYGDELFTSTDVGKSWTNEEVAAESKSFGIMQQLSDGSYMSISVTPSTYYLGGTGFSVKQYSSGLMTSDDGRNWSATDPIIDAGSIEITCIDQEGIIFGKEYNYNSSYQVFTQGVRSEDGGKTFVEFEGPIPDFVSSNGDLYVLSGLTHPETNETVIRKWNGSEWIEDPALINYSPDVTFYTIDRAHSLHDGRLLLVTSSSAYLSQGKF